MRLPDPVQLRLGLRMAAAGVGAYGASLLIGAPQGFWAVVSALLIMQGSVGGTLKAGVDRVIGTVIGAAVGAAAAMLHGEVPALPVVVVLGLALLPTGLAAAVSSTFRAAPISAAIVLLSVGGTGRPLGAASLRVVEIGVGSLVGIAAALLVMPSRAEQLLLQRVADALQAMAALIEGYLVTRPGEPELEEMRRRMRKAIAAAESAAVETRPERVLRRGEPPAVEPLIRTLYRLRNGVAFIGRAAGRAPAAVEATTGRALATFVADCATALRAGRAPPPGAALAAASAAIEMAEPAAPLAFAVEAIRHDLHDLVERIAERAGDSQ
jgi:uncharacterized membrane protein YccC